MNQTIQKSILETTQSRKIIYRIYGQEFREVEQKTVFCIYQCDKKNYVKMTAQEIFYQDAILEKFPISDIRVIALVAAKEELLSDIQKMNELRTQAL